MNQYTYRVPFTEEDLSRDYVQLRMSQDEIAEKYGTTQKVVWRAMQKMGVPTRVAAKRNQKGQLNSQWKGGRILIGKTKRKPGERTSFGNGYYYVLMPTHPNCTSIGYVAEHILVATNARGKPLTHGELVHHIDLDRHNNALANLIICTRKKHGWYHHRLAKIAAELMRHGLVLFNGESGYETHPDLRKFLLGRGRI